MVRDRELDNLAIDLECQYLYVPISSYVSSNTDHLCIIQRKKSKRIAYLNKVLKQNYKHI